MALPATTPIPHHPPVSQPPITGQASPQVYASFCTYVVTGEYEFLLLTHCIDIQAKSCYPPIRQNISPLHNSPQAALFLLPWSPKRSQILLDISPPQTHASHIQKCQYVGIHMLLPHKLSPPKKKYVIFLTPQWAHSLTNSYFYF